MSDAQSNLTAHVQAAQVARLRFGIEIARTLIAGDPELLHLSAKRNWQVGGPRSRAKMPTVVQRGRIADAVLARAMR